MEIIRLSAKSSQQEVESLFEKLTTINEILAAMKSVLEKQVDVSILLTKTLLKKSTKSSSTTKTTKSSSSSSSATVASAATSNIFKNFTTMPTATVTQRESAKYDTELTQMGRSKTELFEFEPEWFDVVDRLELWALPQLDKQDSDYGAAEMWKKDMCEQIMNTIDDFELTTREVCKLTRKALNQEKMALSKARSVSATTKLLKTKYQDQMRKLNSEMKKVLVQKLNKLGMLKKKATVKNAKKATPVKKAGKKK